MDTLLLFCFIFLSSIHLFVALKCAVCCLFLCLVLSSRVSPSPLRTNVRRGSAGRVRRSVERQQRRSGRRFRCPERRGVRHPTHDNSQFQISRHYDIYESVQHNVSVICLPQSVTALRESVKIMHCCVDLFLLCVLLQLKLRVPQP